MGSNAPFNFFLLWILLAFILLAQSGLLLLTKSEIKSNGLSYLQHSSHPFLYGGRAIAKLVTLGSILIAAFQDQPSPLHYQKSVQFCLIMPVTVPAFAATDLVLSP